MAGVNKVILVGHLGKDPEVRSFENSLDPSRPLKKATFSLATTETTKNKDGQKKELKVEGVFLFICVGRSL